jgi:hypothetical protein
MPLFVLDLPPSWHEDAVARPAIVMAQAADGARLAAWANSINDRDAAPDTRRATMAVELRRAGVATVQVSEGKLGGEPAIVCSYDYQGHPHAQLASVRNGIAYRITLKAVSESQRSTVLAALATGFHYPDASAAARARPTLKPWVNALKSAFDLASSRPAGVRAAIAPPNDDAPAKPRR